MKVPLNYKPADNNNGTTLLNSTKPYAYTPPKPFINIEQADYKTWCKADLWTVERAILLLLNAETLPSINSSYGICKSNGEQSIYDGFMKIWPIAESSLEIGVLKKIGKSYPGLLCKVLPGDFICWAKLKGYPIPDELKTIGTATQTEAVGDAGAGNHAGTEPKPKGKNQKRMDILNDWYGALCLKFQNDIEVINQEINSLTNESIKKELASITQANEKHLWANGADRWIMDNGESVWRFKRTQGGKTTKS